MKYEEDNLQKAVATYLDYQNILWCHVANERKSTQIAGKRLKEKGVKSGVPDVLIFEPIGVYIGLAIELKIKPNKPTSTQLEWLKGLQEKGWSVSVCYSFDEFLKAFEDYLKMKKDVDVSV